VNPDEIVQQIEDNTRILVSGWKEKVAYKVAVTYHREECPREGECECPVTHEKRNKVVTEKGLLTQLQNYGDHKDTDRGPKSERAAPRVKTPKLHPELNGFLTLDEIHCDAYMVLDRVFEQAGRDRTWLSQPLKMVLMGLGYQVRQFVEDQPELASEVLHATAKWVMSAKRTLALTVPDAIFGDTVCGICSGGLAIAWDNSSDIRCVGTPATPPCGKVYPKTEWLALYEQQQRAQ
jgi:hypothetical protein